MTDPRAELRRMIAEKIDAKMHSERMDDHFDGQDYADAVMELFPEVDMAREFRGPGWVIGANDAFGDLTTHTRYVLRTAPEPTERPGEPEMRKTP